MYLIDYCTLKGRQVFDIDVNSRKHQTIDYSFLDWLTLWTLSIDYVGYKE